MKKVLLAAFAAALIGSALLPAMAQDQGDTDKKFAFNGMVRGRLDYINNYTDLTDNTVSSDPLDDGFSIFPIRAVVGITGMFSRNVKAHVDLQYVGNFGDEPPQKDSANVFDRFGANRASRACCFYSGPAAQFLTPYQYNTQGVQFYQGFVELDNIGGSDFGLRIGRQEHTSGTELFLGDNDYYAGLSFDGLRGMWQHGGNDLNFFYYRTAELHNTFGGNGGGAVDSNLFGATYDWHFQKDWGTVGGYVLVGQDGGGAGPVFFPDSKVNTIGVHWYRPMADAIDTTMNMFDWNIEYAIQNGDIGEPTGAPSTDISAWVGEAWFGFNFNAGSTHGRAHLGTLMTSGDKASTTKSEEFVTLYGDFQEHNRFGDMDFIDQLGPSNITDFNIGYEHWFGANHYVMAAYHKFKLTEKNGLADDDLGDEIDLKYSYRYSKNVSFEALVGQANPGKALEAEFGLLMSDAVQRVLGQVVVSW